MITFCELRSKSVINVVDGKDLGHVQDLTFCEKGKITGITVPGGSSGFLGLMKCEPLFIEWNRICKIGDDVVLVSLSNDKENTESHNIE